MLGDVEVPDPTAAAAHPAKRESNGSIIQRETKGCIDQLHREGV